MLLDVAFHCFAQSTIPVQRFYHLPHSMITVLTAISAAPYAAGLGLFLLGYFLVFPYIEYLRDPKGICQETSSMLYLNILGQLLTDSSRAEEIPQSHPLLGILSSSIHDHGFAGFPVDGIIRVAQEEPRHPNRAKPVVLWQCQGYKGHLWPQHQVYQG